MNTPGVFPLIALIAAAIVANINLAVANVALPTIGAHFGASQNEINLVAVGFTLGLAATASGCLWPTRMTRMLCQSRWRLLCKGRRWGPIRWKTATVNERGRE